MSSYFIFEIFTVCFILTFLNKIILKVNSKVNTIQKVVYFENHFIEGYILFYAVGVRLTIYLK